MVIALVVHEDGQGGGGITIPRVEVEVEVAHEIVRVLFVHGEQPHVLVPHVGLLHLLEPKPQNLLIDLWRGGGAIEVC